MKKGFINYLVIFISIIISSNCLAWNSTAHNVIATIAYENLKPDVRKKADEMVRNFSKEYPNFVAFSQLGSWADTLRRQKIESFTHWHYIDFAISDDGTPLKNVTDSDNAVWAIKLIEPVVENAQANIYERARFLAFLIHIVGDLHQPLHTVSRISAEFPDGDQGGNLFLVEYNSKLTKLHKIWDEGFDEFNLENSDKNVLALAHAIEAEFPEKNFGAKVNDLDPQDWANEGVELAKRDVYSMKMNQAVSASYSAQGKQDAKQQVALSGYRLAKVLNQLL